MPVDETDNQDLDVESQDGSSGNSDDQGGDDFFLVVDERTKFKSPEDAQKSFHEAGQRISQLSAWEKEIGEQYNGASPQQVRQWLDDYARMLDERDKGQQSAQGKPDGNAKTVSDEQLNPEEQKALDWLKKHAPRLGFVPKEDLTSLQDQMKEMKEQFDTLQRGSNEQFEAQRNSLIEQGRSQLDGLMKDAQLPADPRLKSVIENAIRDYINADDARVKKFYSGQSGALVAEAFKEVADALGVLRGKTGTNFAQNKSSVANRTPRPLPKPGLPRPVRQNQQQEQTPKERITPDVHNRAFAAAQRIWGGGNAEE